MDYYTSTTISCNFHTDNRSHVTLEISIQTGTCVMYIEIPNVDRKFINNMQHKNKPGDKTVDHGSSARRGDFHTELHYVSEHAPHISNYITITNATADNFASGLLEFMDKYSIDMKQTDSEDADNEDVDSEDVNDKDADNEDVDDKDANDKDVDSKGTNTMTSDIEDAIKEALKDKCTDTKN
jgi:hypothetical protein